MSTLLKSTNSQTNQLVLPEYSVIVLGDGGVGKSALTVRLCFDNFLDDYDPTVEDCYRQKMTIDGQEVLLEITDTAGQEEFQGMRDEWLREGDGFLLVYSVDRPSSFERLYEIKEQILQIKETDSAPIVLAGNKCDLESHRVDKAELDQLAKEWNCPALLTSAKTEVNNREVFYQSVREIIRHRNKQAKTAEKEDKRQCQCTSGCTVL